MTATAAGRPLENRVVIVTGAAGLLGREYAGALLEAGARVVLLDVKGETVHELAGALAARGPVLAVEADVTDAESVRAMVSRVLGVFGRIDVLVNNAAVDPKFDRDAVGEHVVGFEEFPLEAWNEALAVNVTGMFLCAQAVARPMLARGGGVIVNVSSIYGMVGPDQRIYAEPGGRPAYKPVTYSVSKSAVYGLTRYLATYWAAKNIRVNALTLGGVEHAQDPGFIARYSARTPLGRMARASECSGALIFLVSDASSYMTGANLVVDGGWTAW
ncbi:MAG: SDR family oxidoreductase [Candidatus Rokubacteria bacterium]|nr:SDR family oxidoreductase [Candidatus Rokubacteria bacterium]